MLGFALLSPTYDVALNEDIVDTQFEAASGGKSGHGWPFLVLGSHASRRPRRKTATQRSRM